MAKAMSTSSSKEVSAAAMDHARSGRVANAKRSAANDGRGLLVVVCIDRQG